MLIWEVRVSNKKQVRRWSLVARRHPPPQRAWFCRLCFVPGCLVQKSSPGCLISFISGPTQSFSSQGVASCPGSFSKRTCLFFHDAQPRPSLLTLNFLFLFPPISLLHLSSLPPLALHFYLKCFPCSSTFPSHYLSHTLSKWP